MAPPFEIRIAVLGYVSAGKTTVINALLRDMYGQVGMRRVTAGVNYFRLHHHPTVGGGKDPRADGGIGKGHDPGTLNGVQGSKSSKARKKKSKAQDQSDAVRSDAMDGGVVIEERKEDAERWIAEDEFSPAAKTLDEISKDNVALRESSFVNVKTFDISISEPLCEVRPDTRLVLVDIPGINEAGADGKYRMYVREHWDTFDCALVVMDGRQGANTEEQVKLLEFVRDNNKEKKDIPTIIVCNKVDDPDDQEQAELVKEAKEEVSKIFAAGGVKIPVFVPTSAEFAYIYRTASLMSFEQFRKFDMERIDRLGRREVGWKFTNLSLNEKLRLTYQAVTDQSLFAVRIRATNFDILLKWIAKFVGGSEVQLKLIQKQMDVALKSLSPEKRFVEKIHDVFRQRCALGKATDDLPSHFWTTYQKGENTAFRSFAKSPSNVKVMAKLVKDLVEYYTFAKTEGLTDELVKCLSGFKSLTVRHLETVLAEEAKAKQTWASRESSAAVRWGSLNPSDWLRICQSFLLLSHSKVFSEEFGRAIMSLEDCKHKWMAHTYLVPSAFLRCPQCKLSSVDFNGFCTACHCFAFSRDCAVLMHLSTAPTPWPRCNYCQNAMNSSYHCKYRNKQSGLPPLAGSFVASIYTHDSIAFICPIDGCSKKLSGNGVCAGCKAIFCLKDSLRYRVCMFCNRELNAGRCSRNNACVGNKITWKELPFGSMLEALRVTSVGSDGSIQPKFPETYRSVVHVDVPSKLSDPKHFGYVAWQYCQFVESLDLKEA